MYPQKEPLSSRYSSGRQELRSLILCSCLHSSSLIPTFMDSTHPLSQTSRLQPKSKSQVVTKLRFGDSRASTGLLRLEKNSKMIEFIWAALQAELTLSTLTHTFALCCPPPQAHRHIQDSSKRRRKRWSLDVHVALGLCCPLPVVSFEERGGSLSEQGRAHGATCPHCTQVFVPLQPPCFNRESSMGSAVFQTKSLFHPTWGEGSKAGMCSCEQEASLSQVSSGAAASSGDGAAEHVLPVSTRCCWPSTAPQGPKRVKKSQKCSPHTGTWT